MTRRFGWGRTLVLLTIAFVVSAPVVAYILRPDLETACSVGGVLAGGSYCSFTNPATVLPAQKCVRVVVTKTKRETPDAATVSAQKLEALRREFGPDADEGVQWVDHFAKVSQFTEDESRELALMILRLGIRGENLSRAMSFASDVAALKANAVDGAAAAVDAIKQLHTVGRIRGQTLVDLGFQREGMGKRLSRFEDVSAKQVDEAVALGFRTVRFRLESVFAAMADANGEKLLGSAGLKVSERPDTARIKKERQQGRRQEMDEAEARVGTQLKSSLVCSGTVWGGSTATVNIGAFEGDPIHMCHGATNCEMSIEVIR